ncbi:hypothetical protein [Streptomyces phaeochromogenes]|uniref:hypothetical protein n=1 Tax=Streptomyces phaeochromogenes TaxID=1923 RepID=UPI0033DB387F
MKALLSSKPVLWFLFLFNLAVAVAAPFVVDGSQGVMTAVGMGVVSLGAGLSLLKGRGQAQTQGQGQRQRQGQRA